MTPTKKVITARPALAVLDQVDRGEQADRDGEDGGQTGHDQGAHDRVRGTATFADDVALGLGEELPVETGQPRGDDLPQQRDQRHQRARMKAPRITYRATRLTARRWPSTLNARAKMPMRNSGPPSTIAPTRLKLPNRARMAAATAIEMTSSPRSVNLGSCPPR